MQSHKTFKKILLSLLFFSLLITLAYPITVEAQRGLFDSTKNPLNFQPQVSIPGLWNADEVVTLKDNNTSYIAKMIKGFYNYGIGIAGILAAIMLMAGGLVWLTSAGSAEKITQAKNLMSGSIIGLVILFGSWMLLRTINPALVDFKISDITSIEKLTYGCCQYDDKAEMNDIIECEKTGGQFKDILVTSGTFGASRRYGLSADGKSCVLPGCCITTTTYRKFCSTTMNYNCDTNSTLAKVTFNPTANCKVLSDCGQQMDSDGKISTPAADTCADEGTKDGRDCFSSDDFDDKDKENSTWQCKCYNGIAWYGFGKKDEPCGNENRKSYCTDDATFWSCNGDHIARDNLGGRDCGGTDLYCCYDERKAQ